MEIKYFIGIDFGHGETAVSRVPGTNGAPVSQVQLKNSGNDSSKKIISAIWSKTPEDEDSWSLVYNPGDYGQPNLQQGFKGIEEENKKYLKAFAKQIFKCINNEELNPDLIYDPKTGESNYIICIANPTIWRAENDDIPNDYLRFYKYDAGLSPVMMCINESDAAFYTHYKDNDPNDTVLVVDMGSSTIDFTLYTNSHALKLQCPGDKTLGAHKIEDEILDYIKKKAKEDKDNPNIKENRKTKFDISKVSEIRKKAGYGDTIQGISLHIREAKEKFFSDKSDKLRISLEEDLFYKTEEAEVIVYAKIDKDTLYNDILKKYIDDFRSLMDRQKQSLINDGVEPSVVILSGGASRMPFVTDILKEVFPEAIIKSDNRPEWVVSDGCAKYAQIYFKTQRHKTDIQEEFKKWTDNELIDAIKDACVQSFRNAIRNQLESALLEKYDGNYKPNSLRDAEYVVLECLNTVTSTEEFKKQAKQGFVEHINSLVRHKLEALILANYRKTVRIDDDMVSAHELFEQIPVSIQGIHEEIEEIGNELFVYSILDSLNWDKERNSEERSELISMLVAKIPENYEYKLYNGIDTLRESITNEVVTNIDVILNKHGLFSVSTL